MKHDENIPLNKQEASQNTGELREEFLEGVQGGGIIQFQRVQAEPGWSILKIQPTPLERRIAPSTRFPLHPIPEDPVMEQAHQKGWIRENPNKRRKLDV